MALYRIEFITQQGWCPVSDFPEVPRSEAVRERGARAKANPKRSYRICVVPLPGVDKAGIAYFDSEHAARHAAERVGWPLDRIIPYGKGWAVQWVESGPYLERAFYLEASREARQRVG